MVLKYLRHVYKNARITNKESMVNKALKRIHIYLHIILKKLSNYRELILFFKLKNIENYVGESL